MSGPTTMWHQRYLWATARTAVWISVNHLNGTDGRVNGTHSMVQCLDEVKILSFVYNSSGVIAVTCDRNSVKNGPDRIDCMHSGKDGSDSWPVWIATVGTLLCSLEKEPLCVILSWPTFLKKEMLVSVLFSWSGFLFTAWDLNLLLHRNINLISWKINSASDSCPLWLEL